MSGQSYATEPTDGQPGGPGVPVAEGSPHPFVRGAGTTAGAPIQHRNARRKANAQQRLKIATPASKRRERKVRM